jgi:hypothetical protein
MMADDAEMDEEIEKQLEAEARNNINNDQTIRMDYDVSFNKKKIEKKI